MRWCLLVACLLVCAWNPPIHANACSKDNALGEVRAVVGVVTVDGMPVQAGYWLCGGNRIETDTAARATVWLGEVQTTVRIKANSQLWLPAAAEPWYVRVVHGIVYFFSRVPRSLNVQTPYLNGGIEGTEFVVQTDANGTRIDVIEGDVLARNAFGEMYVKTGQSVLAKPAQPPARGLAVVTTDVVAWAIYYPPLLLPTDELRYPPAVVEASRLLAAGEVDRAQAVLQVAPDDACCTRSLAAIIAVAQGRRQEALRLAREAIRRDPAEPGAKLALSYALQANLQLQAAATTIAAAVAEQPEHALLQARYAELLLALGHYARARQHAARARELAPDLALAEIVFGFAALAEFRGHSAEEAFTRALALAGENPQTWLGLGIALINQGQIHAGRQALETAVAHDPANALLRSYLGKAYFEENRDALAAVQYALAKKIDPQDPTAWYYDALRAQVNNDPITAVQDLQTAVEKNDNRAVYRSRHHLDQDQAARSASLGRIYRDLGFAQLATRQAYRALSQDPTSEASHRLLADALAGQPRRELVRVAELFQAQLWQPMNINPIRPQLLESDLQVLAGAGPTSAGQYEFNPLFNRDRLSAQVSGLVGNQQTLADDVLLAGQLGRVGITLGQYHYESEGFRENNDQHQDIYSAFVQAALTPKINVQFEARRRIKEQGDLIMRYQPDVFDPGQHDQLTGNRFRGSVRVSPSAQRDILLSAMYEEEQGVNRQTRPFDAMVSGNIYRKLIELGFYQRYNRHTFLFGGGIGVTEDKPWLTQSFVLPNGDQQVFATLLNYDDRHQGLFSYAYLVPVTNMSLTLGLARFDVEQPAYEDVHIAPKLGVVWDVSPGMTWRAAAYADLKRPLGLVTIEPTQIAGFSQLFDDGTGTKTWNFGVAWDAQFASLWFGSLEYLHRRTSTPSFAPDSHVNFNDRSENLVSAYFNWIVNRRFVVGLEPRFEHFQARDKIAWEPYNYAGIRNVLMPISARYVAASGFALSMTATWVMQQLETARATADPNSYIASYPSENNGFMVFDTALVYRLPKRFGRLSIEVNNLFNRRFNYHDYNLWAPLQAVTPEFLPERFFRLNLTLAIQ